MLSSALTLVRRHLPEEFFSYAFYIQVTAVPGASDSFVRPVADSPWGRLDSPVQPGIPSEPPDNSEQPERLGSSEQPDSSGLPVPLQPEQPELPALLVLSGKPWKTGIPLPLLPLLPLLEEKPALPDLPAWPEPEVPAFF